MKKIVVIDGTRTPFLKSGTDYMDLMSYQLGQFAISGLLKKTGIDPKLVDRVIMGTVIGNVKTSNVAREAALTAGIPYTTTCNTVTQACISANQAITSGVEQILAGQAEIVIAGGTDCTSDAPILFNKPMRKKLFNAQKLKGFGDTMKFIFSLRLKDFMPDAPAIAEFTTGVTMGKDCDILAAKYAVAREDQDKFALRSHTLTQKAMDDGILAQEITEVSLPPKFTSLKNDNGVRVAKLEKLSALKPAFIKPHGTLTAANSSFLTDGAAVVLLMTEEKAKELGLKPKAYIHNYAYTGQDLKEELLLGNTYATAKVLKRAGLDLKDMDVIEFHEAFAGQILANLKCLASEAFAKDKLGQEKAVGEIDMNKFNLHGGSLAIGHPFGATGARLVTTVVNRLIRENGRYGLLAACAAGAHGHAMILERYPN